MTPKQIAEALKLAPDAQIFAESARRMGKRSGGARPGAGRPAQMATCKRCGARVTKTQAVRGHGCGKS